MHAVVATYTPLKTLGGLCCQRSRISAFRGTKFPSTNWRKSQSHTIEKHQWSNQHRPNRNKVEIREECQTNLKTLDLHFQELLTISEVHYFGWHAHWCAFKNELDLNSIQLIKIHNWDMILYIPSGSCNCNSFDAFTKQAVQRRDFLFQLRRTSITASQSCNLEAQ